MGLRGKRRAPSIDGKRRKGRCMIANNAMISLRHVHLQRRSIKCILELDYRPRCLALIIMRWAACCSTRFCAFANRLQKRRIEPTTEPTYGVLHTVHLRRTTNKPEIAFITKPYYLASIRYQIPPNTVVPHGWKYQAHKRLFLLLRNKVESE